MKNTAKHPLMKHHGHGVTEVTITLSIAQAVVLGEIYNKMKSDDDARKFRGVMPLLSLFEEFAPHDVWGNITEFVEKQKRDKDFLHPNSEAPIYRDEVKVLGKINLGKEPL